MPLVRVLLTFAFLFASLGVPAARPASMGAQDVGPSVVATGLTNPRGFTWDAGGNLVVAEAGVRFHSSLRFDDLFEIRARISRLGTTSLTTAFVLLRGDERIASGELRHVFVDRERAEKTTIPESIRRALEPYAQEARSRL